MKKSFKLMNLVFVYLLMMVAAFVVFVNVNTYAAAKNVEMVMCAPGEDSSTSVTMSWHGASANSTVYVALADDTSFSNPKTYSAKGTYSTNFVNDIEDIKNYYYDCVIDGLTANTSYIYKVKCGNYYSSVQSFKTAGTSGSFNFLWVGDIHVYDGGSSERYQYLEKLYQAYAKANGTPALIISTGDDTAYGGSYGSWQTMWGQTSVFNNSVYAMTTGNHTEYGNKVSTIQGNKYIEEITAHPNNGCGLAEDSSFWFNYNGTLFFALDAIESHKNSTALKAQKAWFEDVCQANAGKYQYIIVYQHYPWLNALTGEINGPYGTNRQTWNEIFEKYDVDLALSGDYHCYYRSKSMIGTEVVEDGKGVTYIGTSQIGGRGRAMTNTLDADYYYKRWDDDTNYAYASGCTWFSVTPEGISAKFVDVKERVIDEYSVPAKRSVTWESNKDSILNSVVFNYSNSKCYLDMNRTYADCVSEIAIYNGANLLKTVDPNKFTGTIEIDGLDANKVYNLTLSVKYIDGKTKTKDVIASTYAYYGNIGSVNVMPNGNNVDITWKANLQNNIVSQYKLLANGSEIASGDATKTSFNVDKTKVKLTTVYTLQALTSKGEVIYSYDFAYRLYGDANFDGSVNKDDVTYLNTQLRSKYQFSGNEYTLLDLNNDGNINIGDSQILFAYYKNTIKKLRDNSYTVLFLANDGTILNTQTVKEGQNATAPTISASNFAGWSASIEGITSDVVVRPIYN